MSGVGRLTSSRLFTISRVSSGRFRLEGTVGGSWLPWLTPTSALHRGRESTWVYFFFYLLQFGFLIFTT